MASLESDFGDEDGKLDLPSNLVLEGSQLVATVSVVAVVVEDTPEGAREGAHDELDPSATPEAIVDLLGTILLHGGAEDGVDGLHHFEVAANCRLGDLGFSGEDLPHVRLGFRRGFPSADFLVDALLQLVTF